MASVLLPVCVCVWNKADGEDGVHLGDKVTSVLSQCFYVCVFLHHSHSAMSTNKMISNLEDIKT